MQESQSDDAVPEGDPYERGVSSAKPSVRQDRGTEGMAPVPRQGVAHSGHLEVTAGVCGTIEERGFDRTASLSRDARSPTSRPLVVRCCADLPVIGCAPSSSWHFRPRGTAPRPIRGCCGWPSAATQGYLPRPRRPRRAWLRGGATGGSPVSRARVLVATAAQKRTPGPSSLLPPFPPAVGPCPLGAPEEAMS